VQFPRAFPAVVVALLVVGGCRARPSETRVVIVTATPAPVAAIVEPPATPVPVQQADFTFPVAAPPELPVVEPTPLAEAATEPRREPTPDSLHQQMQRCLVFTAEPDNRSRPSHPFTVFLKINVANVCDVDFVGPEVWFDARALPVGGGGTTGRETGRFQTPIRARDRAETFIAIDGIRSDAFYYYEASLWWAAGGGRKSE